MKNLLICSTRDHEGKTLVTLGLTATFQQKVKRIGFIKPIGRPNVKFRGAWIDNDAVLMKEAAGVQCYIKDMSPAHLEGGFPRSFATKKGHSELEKRIDKAFAAVKTDKQFVVVEGTGNAAAGAAFGFSNAEIAKRYNCKVLLVCSGGVGQPIDEVLLNKAYLDRYGVEAIGVVINKVFPDEEEMVRGYMSRVLGSVGMQLLGVIPYVKEFQAPTIASVVSALNGRVIHAPENLENRVSKVLLGAMTPHNAIPYLKGEVTLILPGDREDLALAALSAAIWGGADEMLISGIFFTGSIKPSELVMRIVRKTQIPTVLVDHDSFLTASRINNMVVKLLPDESERIEQAIKLVNRNVNAAGIIKALH